MQWVEKHDLAFLQPKWRNQYKRTCRVVSTICEVPVRPSFVLARRFNCLQKMSLMLSWPLPILSSIYALFACGFHSLEFNVIINLQRSHVWLSLKNARGKVAQTVVVEEPVRTNHPHRLSRFAYFPVKTYLPLRESTRVWLCYFRKIGRVQFMWWNKHHNLCCASSQITEQERIMHLLSVLKQKEMLLV